MLSELNRGCILAGAADTHRRFDGFNFIIRRFNMN